MSPFLFRFTTAPAPAPIVRLRYDPTSHRNQLLDGDPTGDGTLITKSSEAHDQSEASLEAFFGTLLTCTREARDASEQQGIDELPPPLVALLAGTKKTGTGEQSDPSDAFMGTMITDSREARDQSEHAHLDPSASSNRCLMGFTTSSPWPLRRFTR